MAIIRPTVSETATAHGAKSLTKQQNKKTSS
jgi:hypothetical protein